MSIAFRMFEHLLPRSKTWRLLLGKQLREFHEGLANGVPTDLIAKADARYTDVQPLQTLQLDGWDNQFGLPLSGGLTETERRARLVGAWRNTGGQGKLYLEQVLRDHGFPDVFLHEFWEPQLVSDTLSTGAPVGGSGDAYAVDLGATVPDVFETRVKCGNVAGSVSHNAFFRLPLSIPRGATIIRAKFEVTAQSATGTDRVRLGSLVRDGKWDVVGYRGSVYPAPTDYPHPVTIGGGFINSGVMIDDEFFGEATYLAADFVDGTTVSFGSASYVPTYEVPGLKDAIQAFIDAAEYDPVDSFKNAFGLVLSASEHVGAAKRFEIYSEDDLIEIGPQFVVEWFSPAVQPLTVKNPNTYLADGGPTDSTSLDEPLMECGEVTALCGETIGARGFLLVNIVEQSTTLFLGCGDPQMECDEVLALCGEALSVTFDRFPYLIPTDVDEWRYILYVGAEVWPQVASVDLARQEEFESLLLRICPGQQWLGILVDYV